MRPKLTTYLIGAALITAGAALFWAVRAPQRETGTRPPELLRRTSALALSGGDPLPQRLRKKGLQ